MSIKRKKRIINDRFSLDLFCKKANELREFEYVKKGFPLSLKIHWDEDKGESISTQEPDENELKSLLVTLRQFYLKGEAINIQHIYNLCHLHIKNETYKNYLLKSREIYNKSLKNGGLPIIVNGNEMNPERIFDLFINGEIFHTQPEKHMELKSLPPFAYQLFKQVFLYLLQDFLNQIFYVEKIIKASIKEGSLNISDIN